MYRKRSERKPTILGISIVKLFGYTLLGLTLAVSLFFNWDQSIQITQLNYQLSEQGITEIVKQNEELIRENENLRGQIQQLQQDLADARQEISRLKGELERVELEYVTVKGKIYKKRREVFGRVFYTKALEIKFIPITGEGEVVSDNELVDFFYSVSLKNYREYKVMIKYKTLMGAEWEEKDPNYPVYSEKEEIRQNW